MNTLSKTHNVIGADIGCSHAKLTWYNADNELQHFTVSSVIYEAYAPLNFIGGTDRGVNYEGAGRTFNFADNCGVSPFNTKQPSYPYSIENTVILHHVLKMAGFEGNVKVAITMPYDDYFTNVGKNEKNIDKKRTATLQPVLTDDDKQITITDVEVFPEAIIGAYSCYIDDFGNDLFDIQQGLLVVDLGGRTSDLVHITPDWMPSRTGRKSTNAFGSLDVYYNLNDQIRSKGFADVPPNVLDKAMNEGYIFKGNVKLDIRGEIKRAKQSVISRIDTAVDSWLRDGITIDGVLFIGGTTEIFRDELEKTIDSVIAEKPQFSNSRGACIVGNME